MLCVEYAQLKKSFCGQSARDGISEVKCRSSNRWPSVRVLTSH
jgi:hypothetical protein